MWAWVLWGITLLWLTCVAALAVYGFNVLNRFAYRHLPGPRPRWLVGNAARAGGPDMLGPVGKSFLALQRWAQTYGPCFVFYLGRTPVVVLSDPDLVREAGVRVFRTFQDRPMPQIQIGPSEDRAFQDSGILFARGKYWSGVRAACEPLFHRAALASYAPAMNKCVDVLAERLALAAGGEAGVNISDALNCMTMDVIGSTAFGVDFGAQQHTAEPNKLLEAAQYFFKPFASMNPLLATLFYSVPHLGNVLAWLALRMRSPRVYAVCEARALLWGASQQLLDNARKGERGAEAEGAAGEGTGTGGMAPGPSKEAGQHGGREGAPTPSLNSLAARRAAAFERGRALCRSFTPPATSIIHKLRNAKNQTSGAALSDMEICAQLFTFLLAGYETTSLALGYTLYEVARAPALQARLAEEAQAALRLAEQQQGQQAGREGGPGGLGGEHLGYEQLRALPLAEASFCEAMRLYPPTSPLIALARAAQQDTTLGGFRIPKGSHMVFNANTLHRDPQHFPNPEAFRPERFLPDSPENLARHPYAYLPFGVGPRKCVGYKFALEEGTLALARLVSQFEFSLDPEHHVGPLDLVMGLTLNVRGGIWLRVRRRA